MSAARGEFALTQVVIRLASTLEQIRVMCDRAHEESVLADRDGRTLECHYAFALGAVWMTVAQQLEELQRSVVGLRRSDQHADEADARARAALDAFMRQVRALDGGAQ